jgi:hypothetical protein
MKHSHIAVLLLSGALLAACKEEDDDAAQVVPFNEHAAPAKNVASTTGQPQILVHKTATCGCCEAWVEHMQSAGFPVRVENADNLGPIKERVGVPYGMGSCHTAEVGGYFIEGHVPAADVQRLLSERPNAKGLVVAGMPVGSPGMEQGGHVDRYQVLLVHEDGSTSVYDEYPK